MKGLIRFFVLFSAGLFTLVAVIKLIKGCSWKDAVGIIEELWKEVKETMSCEGNSKSET